MASWQQWVFGLIVAGLVAIAPVHAESLGPDRARDLVERGEILPLEELLRRIHTKVEGQIIEVELEQDDGDLLYEIKLLTPSGRYREFKADPKTGAIVDGD